MRTAVKTATAASKAHLRKQAIRSHAIVGQVAETGLLLVCELLGYLVRDTHGAVDALDVIELLEAVNQTLDLPGIGKLELGRRPS